MSIDAVALFRPKQPSALRPYLDLDEESEESDGLYAEALDDGSVLVHTFQAYAAFQASPIEGRAWLSQFGADLPLVHDDPRGFLFFPDVCEPSGRTYDAVVKEIASAGIWIPAVALTAEEAHAREATMVAEIEAIQRGEAGEVGEAGDEDGDEVEQAPFGMEGLPALAQQMLASLGIGSPEGPTDLAGMMEAVQKQLMGAMGGQAGGFAFGDGEVDEGDFDAVALLLKRKTPLLVAGEAAHDVNEITTLADGTAVIHTTAVIAGREMVALRLAEDHAHWASEHDDARGVPSFGASHLEAIRGAASYEAALATLGEEVVFLEPRSLDALRTDKKAGLRRLVGGGEGEND